MANVLVTGATGFIASHCVLRLIEQGHNVRGTARSADRATHLSKTLSAYSGRPVQVPVSVADLCDDAGWQAAVEGMDYVLHVASPIPANLPRNPDDLIIPAREGARRVLRASKAAGVKRVVLTSSVAAISYGWGTERPDLLTEAHWSDPDNLKDNTAYTRSKTIAERAAWDFMASEGSGMEMVAVNPAAVLGPVMCDDFSASLELVTQLLGGRLPALPKMGFQLVDVRDVADAHLLAMEHPRAAGERFILADDFMWLSELADLLRTDFPQYAKKIPSRTLPSWLVRLMAPINPPLKQILPELGQKRLVSSRKARDLLGWSPRNSRQAVLAAANSLVAHGVV